MRDKSWKISISNQFHTHVRFDKLHSILPLPPMAKNIWVAASDGDLDRVKVRENSLLRYHVLLMLHVQHLIEHENQTPNDHDEFSYTPMYD